MVTETRVNNKIGVKMSETIQKFVFADANEVRVVMRNDEPWFVAKDVCEILGTRTDNVRQIVGNKRVMSIDPYTIGVLGNGKSQLIVSESGLYKLIMASRKKEAVKFQDWVTDDVLPTIRKHGAYMTDRTLAIMMEDPDYVYKIAEMLVEEKRQRVLAESERDDAVKTKAWISDKKTATALQRNSVLKRRINSLEREKQAMVDDYDAEIYTLKEKLIHEEYDACRYRDWRSHVGRKPKGWTPLNNQIPLF